MRVTPQAKRAWEEIPKEFRMKILNNVWCGSCRKTVNIAIEKMSLSTGMLKLDGKYMTCDGPVCRVIERDS